MSGHDVWTHTIVGWLHQTDRSAAPIAPAQPSRCSPPTPSSLLSLLPFRSRVLQRMPMQRQQMLQQGAAYAAAIVAICIGTWAT